MPNVSAALKRIGVDRAIGYTLIGRGWNFLSGPVTLLLIARFLTGEEQGFYYTFSSVLGLQVLFELGLAFVIFQFASHEKAKLNWMPNGRIEGDPEAEDRLLSLLRKALRWYAVLGVLVLAILLPGGFLFFSNYRGHGATVNWQFPWIWVVTVTAFDLLASPIVAVLEGSSLVSEVALVRTSQVVLGGILTWIVFIGHGGLMAAPVSNTVVFLGWWVWLLFTKRPFLKQVSSYVSRGFGIDWRREVWPFQWRIGLSGASSYFIFLIFTPILFMFQGAVVAGQMGMSAAVMNAVSTIAITWVSTKMSPFGTLIAQGDFRQLDQLFFPSLWKSMAVMAGLGGAFWLGDLALNVSHSPWASRILPPGPLLLLLGTTVINHAVGVEAMYLRAHKAEPFLVLSVVVALLTAISTYLLARSYSVTAMLAGNFLITLFFSLGWGTSIFIRMRQTWHGDRPALAPNQV